MLITIFHQLIEKQRLLTFFFMHLRNKPVTEYTGQETYVWEMYNNRCWDFFPVGDCFRKQYNSDETTS
ncbi:RYR2 [Bugula neritina]|uniref:RYR2 n=1 Tax=Bugula neritina TaxID=10212 RepID=A0A7J7JNU0_BUGNE|nr:RYR2 [Bugula neritina]